MVEYRRPIVIFRTRRELFKARLVRERNRAFAVLYEYGRKGSNEVIKEERIELDLRFLEKMDPKHGADSSTKRKLNFQTQIKTKDDISPRPPI